MPTSLNGSLPDLTGHTLDNDRYFLESILGSGAYGKVYKAIDTRSASDDTKYVAIKCLVQHATGSRHDQFQRREFALHKQVSSHPHIVTFHRIFYDTVYVYVVLDLIEGGDLFKAIVEQKLFQNNDARIKRAYIQLLDAVQCCHEQDVFHRDLKPENILHTRTKFGTHLYLADFGLSTDQRTSNDFGCGSPYYMSPGASSL
jgi:serine/threonine protein kinase